MQINIMRSKIHRAIVTQADLNYEGSISIDQSLIDASGILHYEKVDVLNINNGERFSTYVIPALKNSGEIKVNGAAARKVQVGDPVIIIAYASMSYEEAKNFIPKVIIPNKNNSISI